jgi:hypothetical protein
MDNVSIIIAIWTIFIGGVGFLAPRYTASALDLETTGSTMGLSELRAGSGGLYVVVGLYCVITMNPWGYFMLGVAYGGAGLGRGLSIILDKPPMQKALTFLALEWPLAAWLIWMNWPA